MASMSSDSDADQKGLGGIVELLPRGGDPDAPPLRFMELQFSRDLHTLEVKRAGPDGKPNSFEINIETAADISRLFAAEVVGLIATQANRNFQTQGLSTSMSAPVIFSDEGHVVSEIFKGGKIYRRTVFDPTQMLLTVAGENGTLLRSVTVPGVAEVPLELAKVLGVKLPLDSVQ